MKHVRARAHFYANKSMRDADVQKEVLENRLESLLAEWVRDTGIWDVDATLVVAPDEQRPGYFQVRASVMTEAKPLRQEAGGVPA